MCLINCEAMENAIIHHFYLSNDFYPLFPKMMFSHIVRKVVFPIVCLLNNYLSGFSYDQQYCIQLVAHITGKDCEVECGVLVPDG